MSIYAIGDVQGCYDPLRRLLDHLQFDPARDTLWFAGDIVNRGPQSLEVLRFIKSLGNRQQMVLGNHDLHLLAVASGHHPGWSEDTLQSVLTAPDRDELLLWLAKQPLLHEDTKQGYVMVHAGVAPSWNLATAKKLAKEVEIILQSEKAGEFYQHMYGNEPTQWQDTLTGYDRLRCIVNYFTRARFCDSKGNLELKNTGGMRQNATELTPWFQVANRLTSKVNIIFGHWAALGGVTNTPHAYAIDTGCVWGFTLTAMRLSDQKRFNVECCK